MVVVDDDPDYRELVRRVLVMDDSIEVAGTASDAVEGLALIQRERPDVVLMDVRMPGLDGITATERLKAMAPEVEVVTLTALPDPATIRAVVLAGSSGYLVKGDDPNAIPLAVRAVHEGESLLSPRVARSVLQDMASLYRREHRRAEQLAEVMRSSAEALTAAIEARDAGTGAHSSGVPHHAMEVLRAVDPAAATDPLVEYGFLLHDVGKIAVPDAVLLKPGPLEADEWEQMRQHPLWGAQILERIPNLSGTVAVQVVRHHHERWDGAGYPSGLRRTEIPSPCRAFAVVDAFDAMTRDRPYRKAMPTDMAIEQLSEGRGSQFDPEAVDAFLDLVDRAG